MDNYERVVEHRDIAAVYDSPSLGRFEAVTHLATVAVKGPENEIVWEKTVRDRIITCAVPLPFFDRRLALAARRAASLTDALNSQAVDANLTHSHEQA